MKKIINTKHAPAAIGPYSQAVQAGDYVFISGQIPLDPKTGEIVGETAAEQTKQVLQNMGAILHKVNLEYEDVIKTTIMLVDIDDFQEVNEIYASFFQDDSPARATYAVDALPKGVKVEIEAIAYLKQDNTL